ncbi:MAG TPA: hypothetical protein VF522_20650 [Ramlibacter sp.]|uniref:hypothetical protein n=1 Tax=Ramlibacter sp. TaxID=1917967 RepID=UPI002ED60D30
MIRQASLRTDSDKAVSVPSERPGLRPRWAGIAAAAVFGGIALAALVPTPSPTARNEVPPAGAPATIATPMVQTAAGGEQRSLPMDDGVPTATEFRKAAAGHCEHGL